MLAAAASPQSSMRRRRLLPIRPSTPIADPDSPNLVLNPSSEVWISPTSCPPFDITSPLPPAPKLSPITFGTPADTSRQRLVKSSTTAMTMMARPNFQERLKKVIERDDAYLRSHLYVPQREENTTTTSSSSSNRRSTHRHADAQPTLERTYATLPVSLLTELFIPYRRLARNNALPTPMPPPCDAHLQQQQQHHHHHREGQDVIPKIDFCRSRKRRGAMEKVQCGIVGAQEPKDDAIVHIELSDRIRRLLKRRKTPVLPSNRIWKRRPKPYFAEIASTDDV